VVSVNVGVDDVHGRGREFAKLGCGRSIAILSQSSVATREGLLSPNSVLLDGFGHVLFQGGPVGRPENRHGRLWVGMNRSIRWTDRPLT